MTLQCRTCATSTAIEFLHIFEPEHKYAKDMQEVLQELRYRWNLEVEEGDKLPQHICNICLHEFSVYFHFKQNCLTAQQELYVTIALGGNRIKNEAHFTELQETKIVALLSAEQLPNRGIDPRETSSKFTAQTENEISAVSILSNQQQLLPSNFPTESQELKLEPYAEQAPLTVETYDTNVLNSQSDVDMHDELIEYDVEIKECDSVECNDLSAEFDFASIISKHSVSVDQEDLNSTENVFEDLKTDDLSDNNDLDSEHAFDEKFDFNFSKKSAKKTDPSIKQIYCEFCYYSRHDRHNRKSYRDDAELRQHVQQTHSQDKPYNCHLCDRSYKLTSARNQHIRHTHNKRRYLCDLCGKMVMPGGLRAHMEIFHIYGDFTCSICGAEFKNMSMRSFQYHQRWHDPTKQYKCDQCDRIFVQCTKYNEHMARHNKTGTKICSYCDKRFIDVASLNHHLYTSHAGVKPEKCNYCERRFTTYKQKITHMTLNHGYVIKGRTDTCKFCGKFVTNKSKHKCKNSENYKPSYKVQKLTVDCKICFKFFSTEQNLTKHMSIHSSEGRPFSCTLCELYFKTKRNLTVHNMLLHDTSAKPFACEYCDKTFRLKHLLKTHMKLHLDGAKSERCRVKRFGANDQLDEDAVEKDEEFGEHISNQETIPKNIKKSVKADFEDLVEENFDDLVEEDVEEHDSDEYVEIDESEEDLRDNENSKMLAAELGTKILHGYHAEHLC